MTRKRRYVVVEPIIREDGRKVWRANGTDAWLIAKGPAVSLILSKKFFRGGTMTMLERAAKAAWENHRSGNHLFGGPPQDEDWGDLTVQQKAALCVLVAAVLRAIREPDRAVWDAGAYHTDEGSTTDIWQAMIDAILKEGESRG